MKRPVACFLSVWMLACQPSDPAPLSEVVVQIDADALVQEAGDTLIIEIASGATRSALVAGEPETFDLTAPGFRWPVSITLVAKPAHEDHVFQLDLRLEKHSEVIARGRVQSGFAKGRTLILQKLLGAECLGKLDCADDETCVVNNGRAACESATVDPKDLPTKVPAKDAGAPRVDAGGAGQLPGTGGDAATQDAGFDASGCIALGPEDCTNGVDDDCNGAADCADRACEAITQCVPEPEVFVLVGPQGECPMGYEPLDTVYRDLKDDGCYGCSCTARPKVCEAHVNVYGELLSCQRDTQNNGGMALPNPAPPNCSTPIGKQIELPNGGFGFNVNVKAGQDACDAFGDAKLSEPTWGQSYKRCSARLQRGGCELGYCAPRAEDQALCWPPGDAGCGPTFAPQTYHQSYDDTRRCEACSCTANGGSCSDVGATLTTDESCKVATVLRDGERSCEMVSKDAMVRATGKPRLPVCTAGSVRSGALLATGAVELCCAGAPEP